MKQRNKGWQAQRGCFSVLWRQVSLPSSFKGQLICEVVVISEPLQDAPMLWSTFKYDGYIKIACSWLDDWHRRHLISRDNKDGRAPCHWSFGCLGSAFPSSPCQDWANSSQIWQTGRSLREAKLLHIAWKRAAGKRRTSNLGHRQGRRWVNSAVCVQLRLARLQIDPAGI